MNFYKSVFNGTIEGLRYFESAPMMEVDPEYKKKVLHAVLHFGETTIMASDTLPGFPYVAGNNINLSLNIPVVEEAERIFRAMSEGGKVNMPFEDTFWGARFGMLTDQFGINWMVNCEQKK